MVVPTGGGFLRTSSVKPVPIRKTFAIGHLHAQGAHHALVFALAGNVLDHHGFGVLQRLELEQHIAAAGHVRCVGQVQHQPFAAAAHHFIQLALEHGAVGDAKLLHRDQLRPLRCRRRFP